MLHGLAFHQMENQEHCKNPNRIKHNALWCARARELLVHFGLVPIRRWSVNFPNQFWANGVSLAPLGAVEHTSLQNNLWNIHQEIFGTTSAISSNHGSKRRRKTRAVPEHNQAINLLKTSALFYGGFGLRCCLTDDVLGFWPRSDSSFYFVDVQRNRELRGNQRSRPKPAADNPWDQIPRSSRKPNVGLLAPFEGRWRRRFHNVARNVI